MPGYSIDMVEICRFSIEPVFPGETRVVLTVKDYRLKRYEKFIKHVFAGLPADMSGGTK
jgi:hypothetical protein